MYQLNRLFRVELNLKVLGRKWSWSVLRSCRGIQPAAGPSDTLASQSDGSQVRNRWPRGTRHADRWNTGFEPRRCLVKV